MTAFLQTLTRYLVNANNNYKKRPLIWILSTMSITSLWLACPYAIKHYQLLRDSYITKPKPNTEA
jgi:hypothetical protein